MGRDRGDPTGWCLANSPGSTAARGASVAGGGAAPVLRGTIAAAAVHLWLTP